MHLALFVFILIPLLGFLISLMYKNHHEKSISSIAIFSSVLQVILAVILFFDWFFSGKKFILRPLITIYQNSHFEFRIELFYDKLSMVFSLVSSILFFYITAYSKYYMHRESGFKRYFNQILFFNFGINILVVSGNFETFFVGWEIIGIASFLLIAFYRERFLPVKNSLKVLSFFRLGDIALVCAFWEMHHLFQANIHFEQLITGYILHDGAIINHPDLTLFIAFLLIMAAAIKSTQFPFSTWLPRAMEGPTVSSSIFYGALSVHIGLFLLIRTYPLWHELWSMKILVICIGAITAFICNFIAQVQSTAKSQIAYSSITQIGIMFIEIGFGFEWFALIHFSANAFLRSYQLLVSPSTMSYLSHQQFFNFNSKEAIVFSFFSVKIRTSLYILSLKEWNLDKFWFKYIWNSFKKLGNSLSFIRKRWAAIAVGCILFLGIIQFTHRELFPFENEHIYSYTYSILGFIMILLAWTERRSIILCWVLICVTQMFFMLSIIEHHQFKILEIIIYLSGITSAFLIGLYCLIKVKKYEKGITLNEFHGHIYEHPILALFFLISSLIMIGFPITPTFLGFDILFSEIDLSNRFLLIVSALTFIFLEYAVLRLYARVFLGLHSKNYHEVAYRNS